MDDIPTYSEAGLDVIDAFYQDYVAAIFFFEDEHHESVYERILLRLIPTLRSFQVICLGGKTKIIAKAKEARPLGAKWLFVLDKDFDDLLGSVFSHKDVYYLRAFSLENYLIDLSGIISLAVEMNPRQLTVRSAREKCMAFPQFFLRLRTSLERISRLMIVARRHRVNIPTTKLSVSDLLEGSDVADPIPTEEWYAQYLSRFLGALPKSAEWLAQEELRHGELERAFVRDPRANFPAVSIPDHFCGKHFLGCLLRAAQAWLGVSFSDLDVVELYARLAAHIDIKRLMYLEHAISADHPDIIEM